MTIDWAKPLEWVDDEGAITPVKFDINDGGDYFPYRVVSEFGPLNSDETGLLCADVGIIRNCAEPEAVTPDEIPEWVKVGEIAKSSVTLRDRFAMAALGGVFRHTTKQDFDDADSANNFIVEAGIAYKIADAMMAARNG